MKSSASTRNRLIDAATQVFAEAGVQGATTREIARVAGVNEVTLFRHFASKEQLLSAVIAQVLAVQTEAISHLGGWTQNLQLDLKRYAELYDSALEAHQDLIRTLIGEAKRRPEVAQGVIQGATQPLKEKLIAHLKNNQMQGVVRSDLDPILAVDTFTGMLLAGMLRRTMPFLSLSYDRDHYIATCVEIFVRGISTLSPDVETTAKNHNN